MPKKDFIGQLQKSGYKLTSPRLEILKALSTTTPSSAYEIFNMLKNKGSKVDIVTTYRTLDLFEKLGFIRKIQIDNRNARYELVGNKHHHHLVCVKCEDVQDVLLPKDLNKQEEKIASEKNFKVLKHSLEFFGLCLSCQKQNPVY